MFDRESLSQYPSVKYRTDVLRGVLLRQAVTVIVLAALSAAIAPTAWLALVPAVLMLTAWGMAAVMTAVRFWRLGNETTFFALKFGSELVGPNAYRDIHQSLDEMSAQVGCPRPRFFILAEELDDISPAATWICRGRPCISISNRFVALLPHLAKYILAHEFAHILLDELRIKAGVLIGNMVVWSAIIIFVLWNLLTLTLVVTSGVGPLEFLLRQMLLMGTCTLIPWFWLQTTNWLSLVMHAGEFAADEIGAVLAKSRQALAEALQMMEISLHGPLALDHTSNSHPSTALRIRVLLQGFL